MQAICQAHTVVRLITQAARVAVKVRGTMG